MQVEPPHRDDHECPVRLHGRSPAVNGMNTTPTGAIRNVGVSSHVGDAKYTDMSSSGNSNITNGGAKCGFSAFSAKHPTLYSRDRAPDGTTTTTTNGHTIGNTSGHAKMSNEMNGTDKSHGVNNTHIVGEAKVTATAAAVPISIASSGNNNTSSSINGGSGGGERSFLEFNSRTASSKMKIFAAVLYAAASIGIMMLTKSIFTEFDFHCFIFIGFLQYMATSAVSLVRRHRGSISFPIRGGFRILFVDLFPLPMVFVFNTLSGLGATQSLNMPLFVLLRRLSIAMTLGCEAIFLRYHHDLSTRVSVFLMLAGAFVATGFDVQDIPIRGVLFVLVNDICTALTGVFTRCRFDEGRLSPEGVMFYTNAFAAVVAGLLLLLNVRGELEALLRETTWSPMLVFLLLLNAMAGYGISYCTYLCMKLNSPLTVSMIGAGKNVVTSYAGMAFRDYAFSMPSFLGVNISVVGCVLYSYSEMKRIMRRTEVEGTPQSQQQQ
ncbi:UAA transporter [Trypanosoma melophagium]|uniref:UAA transporter n=1 Tax=Trypanosoma melophagium TaxID=715481 RepID=UPI00351A4997|nr:UAA transporter [Trypanosoma melophagium]